MKTPRHRTAFMIDKDLYEALKEVPRGVSMSDVANVIFKFFIDDLKKFPGMTDEEVKQWRKMDPKRLEVVEYLRNDIGLGKYIDAIDKAMNMGKKKKVEKKHKGSV